MIDLDTIKATMTPKAAKTAQDNKLIKAGQRFTRKAVHSILTADPQHRADHLNREGAKAINEAANLLEDANKHMASVLNQLVATEDGLDKTAQKLVGRAKDRAQQTADALTRINKMIGPDFEPKLKQLERLVDGLDRLYSLQERGLLGKMLEALKH